MDNILFALANNPRRSGLRISVDDSLVAQFGQKPGIDVLFHSAARIEGGSFLAILLTGMGKDGAEAVLLRLGKSVVFSRKPREGGSCFLTPKDIVLSARSSCFMSGGIFPIS
ncbi:chemotaxis protein CheB [Oligoflexus sp.]|uniref:chemotaxis protein CheB n=1 Tax=Oligoflexus sp. TaxID=1971216 RepID=UPI002D78AC38|nr:chemotaxis protein CheB [Oligoflexus sp.]